MDKYRFIADGRVNSINKRSISAIAYVEISANIVNILTSWTLDHVSTACLSS